MDLQRPNAPQRAVFRATRAIRTRPCDVAGAYGEPSLAIGQVVTFKWADHKATGGPVGIHVAPSFLRSPLDRPVPGQHGLRVVANAIKNTAVGIEVGKTQASAGGSTWVNWLLGDVSSSHSPLLSVASDLTALYHTWGNNKAGYGVSTQKLAPFKKAFDGVQDLLVAWNTIAVAPPLTPNMNHLARAVRYVDRGDANALMNTRWARNRYVGPAAGSAPKGVCLTDGTNEERIWPWRVQPRVYDQGNDQCVYANLEGLQASFAGLQGDKACLRVEEGSVMGLAGAGVGACLGVLDSGQIDNAKPMLGHKMCPLARPEGDATKDEDFRGWLRTTGTTAADMMCFYQHCKQTAVPYEDCTAPKAATSALLTNRCSFKSDMVCR